MELRIFKSNEFGSIRTVNVDGEPWLVGKDVAEALGYQNGSRDINRHVDEDDRRGYRIGTASGEQVATIINESGLYSLVMSSKLPGAKRFKRWVTSEVLPSIRKHGVYANEDTLEQMLSDPDTMIRTLTALKEEREQRKALEAKVEQDAPRVLFAHAVESSRTSILVGDLAKLLTQNGYHIGQNRLFAWLRENGYLCRFGDRYNLPTQRSMERGWFEIKESTVNNPDGSIRVNRTVKVTGRGQTYFINLFLGGGKDGEHHQSGCV